MVMLPEIAGLALSLKVQTSLLEVLLMRTMVEVLAPAAMVPTFNGAQSLPEFAGTTMVCGAVSLLVKRMLPGFGTWMEAAVPVWVVTEFEWMVSSAI
jgi:hypothetical protein